MVDNQHITKICEGIGELFGLHFPDSQRDSLFRNVRKAAVELNYDSTPAFLANWVQGPALTSREMQVLAKYLTIGETYFFREKVALDLFTQRIIPALVAERKGKDQSIRIWSAGCSSGEEPYTIAILLNEMIPDIQSWNIKILAADINPEAILKARGRIYTSWSFRETSGEIREKYFVPEGVHYKLKSEIAERVTFTHLNLAKDIFPAPENDLQKFDVIFCRNVLMYFTPSTISRIASQFNSCLNEGGWLITSQVELNEYYFSSFARTRHGSGIFYRKLNAVNTLPEFGSPLPDKKESAWLSSSSNPPFGTQQLESTHTVLQRDRSKVQKAVATSQKVLEHPAGNINPHDLFAAGKYQSCADECHRRLQKDPFDASLGYLLVKTYANMGNLDAANEWAVKLVEVDGANCDSLFLFATVLIEQDELAMAEKVLTKVLYLKPLHLAACLNLGRILKQLGKNQQAAKQYQNLLRSLEELDDEAIVPETEGITVGILKQLTKNILPA
jgi:chemotaxis protein methyltransferase CheR